MRIALMARVPFTFNGRMLDTGDRFEASPIETVVLRVARKATFAPDEIPEKKPKSRRTYRRRDLTAERE